MPAIVQWDPQPGDEAVELWTRRHSADRAGKPVRVHRITQTLIITSDGERYSRAHLTPVSEGRYSDRHLVPAGDDRVLCVRGRDQLAEVARVAGNLAALDRKDPADIAAALAQIVTAANDARRDFAELLSASTRGGSVGTR